MKRILITSLLILFLGQSSKAEEVKDVLNTLYFYRPNLTKSLETISKLPPESVLDNLEKVNPRSLNYLGYHLLAAKDKRAIPLLIEFMNPKYKNENQADANYKETWTLLQMMISDQFVISNKDENLWYGQFKTWWQTNGKNFNLALEDSALNSIFQNIKTNEDKAYKNNW